MRATVTGVMPWSVPVLLGVSVLLMPPTAAQPPSHPFTVGQPFPDLALPALADGQPGSLARFRGRKVLLQVFAAW